MFKRILNLPFVVVNWKSASCELNMLGKIVVGIPFYFAGLLVCSLLLFMLIVMDLWTLLFTKWREPMIGYQTHRFGLRELWEEVKAEDVRNLN